MIENERQYKITKSRVKKFDDALFELSRRSKSIKEPDWVRAAQIDSIEIQLLDLRKEIAEYESIRDGLIQLPTLETISDVPELLIKWRIYRGLTQGDLASILGLAKQQLQKYEQTRYASASLSTIQTIASVLASIPSKKNS